MSALQYGLTPKTKPLSPKRSAMVAALDIGTSKIACLIARLRPNAPPEVLHRRSHSVEVLGFGHTLARGMKAGSVVDLAGAEEASWGHGAGSTLIPAEGASGLHGIVLIVRD